MMPAFSARNSTWPPLAAVTAPFTSIVTVPSRGFGISPRGPRILPSRPTTPIMSGRRDAAVEVDFAGLHLLGQVLGAHHVGAGRQRLLGLRRRGRTRPTRTVLPVPFGSEVSPRTIWSACRGSMPRFIDISTVSSNFALAFCFTSLIASASG